MFAFTYTLAILLMIALPVAAAIALRRYFRVPWLLFIAGILTFTAAQVVHFPLNDLLTEIGWLRPFSETSPQPFWLSALALGLTAGLSEELARAGGILLLKRYRRFPDGVMLGLGHGGIEAMIFGGVLTAASASALLPLRGVDLGSLNLPADQLSALSAQLALFTSSPWLAAAPLVERLLALILQVVFSLLVLRAFQRRNAAYLVLAIGYHAAVDGVLVYIYQYTQDVWLIEGLFVLMLLPGAVWLATLWRGAAARPARRRAALASEINGFLNAYRKELLGQWRTKRLLVTLSVFTVFGLISPLIARFTPEIIKSIEGAQQFADLIPDPTIADSLTQYIKNITQFGFILAILLGMGAVAGEKERGTAELVLSKPLPRWAFLASKYAAQATVYLGAFLLSGTAAYYYTAILFGQLEPGAFIAMNLLLLLWLLNFAAIALLGSALGNSTSAAAGFGLSGAVLLLIAGSLPQVGALAPGALTAWASQLGSTVSSGGAAMFNGGALAMSLATILLCLIGALAAFENQEL